MAVLSVEAARKRYGEVQALDGVSFALEPGRVLGLLGPNGSGKSTLLRCITTLERLDEGRIEVDGHEVAADPAGARGALGYAGQDPAVDKVLTGRESLRFQAGLVHLPAAEIPARVGTMLAELGLQDAADRRVEGYSGGMRRRLDLAASLLHRPPLLVLDEPSSGLDYDARRALWDFLLGLKEEGTAVLVATHDFEEAAVLCDEVVLLTRGRVAAAGRPDDLRRELGPWVLSAALHEHPRAGDYDRLAAILDGIPGRSLPPDPRRAGLDRVVSGPVNDPRSGEAWASVVQEEARRHDAELFAVTVRRPTLQDVYRAATDTTPEEV